MSECPEIERHGNEGELQGGSCKDAKSLRGKQMKYVLLDYVGEAGWPQLTREEQKHWLGAYKAYMEAMTRAGVLKYTIGLQPTATATTVRVASDKPKVLDGPYTDSKEQLGGFH